MPNWLCFGGCCPRKLRRNQFGDFSKTSCSSFTELPAELKRRVTDFLPVQEALRLRTTSTRIYSDLGLTVRPPFQILHDVHWQGDLDSPSGSPLIATIIPVFERRRTHSITVECQCHEQCGNGKLYVLAHRCFEEDEDEEDGDTDDDAFSISRGTIVAELCFTGHLLTTRSLSLSFQPKSDEMYDLWYQVGGGPGNQLRLRSVCVYAVVYENEVYPFLPWDQSHNFDDAIQLSSPV